MNRILLVCILLVFAASLVASQTCNGLSASNPAVCSGRGTCTGPNTCSCFTGWTGPECQTFTCSGNSNCNNRGVCVGPNKCACNDGFSGLACEANTRCPAESLIFYAPFDMTNNATWTALSLTPDLVSGRFIMMENTTIATAECAQGASFASRNAEAVFDKDLVLGNTFQIEFKFLFRTTATGEEVVLWMYDREPSIVVRSNPTNVTVDIRHNNISNNIVITTSNFRDNQYHHISIIRSGTTFSASIDGMPRQFVTVASLNGVSFGARNIYSLIFGHDPWFRFPFTGVVDEFKIWNCIDGILQDCRLCSCLNNALCVARGLCRCPSINFAGANCDIGCFGLSRTDSNVCSGNGTCVSSNNCLCREGYSGPNCNILTCNGVASTNSSVCSGRGVCSGPNICTCSSQFRGPNCQFHLCNGKASNDPTVCSGSGACLNSGICQCNSGFSGNDCQTRDTTAIFCFGKGSADPTVCSSRGQCLSTDRCQCASGYAGQNCEVSACFGFFSNDTRVCNGAGTCTDRDRCNCKTGFSGSSCDVVECFGRFSNNPAICSGRGRCVDFNQCVCNPGYTGDCSLTICYNKNSTDPTVCSGSSAGSCTAPNVCTCNPGRSGLQCEVSVCFNKLSTDRSVCNGRGRCTGPNTCVCNSGWTGTDCNTPICNGKSATDSTVCSGKGVCVGADTCQCFASSAQGFYSGNDCQNCRPDYQGTNCNTPRCDSFTCSGRGTCSNGVCTCNTNFSGQFCQNCAAGLFGATCSVSCTPAANCNNRGSCDSTGSCVCNNSPGTGRWTGTSCSNCVSEYYGTGCNFGIGANFTFSSNFDSITGLLEVPGQTTNFIACSLVFASASLSTLGVGPICSWQTTAPSSFRVQLGRDATVNVGNTLSVIVGPSPVTVNVLGPANPIAPTAVINGRDSISLCDDTLSLNAFGSLSPDRRSLNYRWGVSSGFQIAAVQTHLRSQSGATATVPRSLLTSEFTYVFTLQVVNTFGVVSSTVTKSVFVSGQSTFQVSVVGPNTASAGVPFTLSGVVSPPVSDACRNSLSIREVTTNWRQVSGPSITPSVQGRNLLFGASTLPPIQATFVFEFTAAPVANPSSVASATHTFTTRAGALVAVIAGGDRIVPNTVTLVLDGSRSYDESASPRFGLAPTPLQYRWACSNLTSGDSCGAPLNNLPSASRVSLPLGGSPAAVGEYQFTLTVLSGSRSASANQVVVVSASSIPLVTFRFPLPPKISRGQPLRILTSVDDVSRYDFVWRVFFANGVVAGTSVPLDSLQVETGATSAAIRFSGLGFGEGQQYRIRVEATDRQTRQVGFSESVTSVNSAPQPGVFSVLPPAGTAGTTTFTFTADGWVDEDTPLSYTFGYLSGTSRIVLRQNVQTSTISSILPRGSDASNQLTVFLTVSDSFGASTTTTQTVIVNPIQIANPVEWARNLFADQSSNAADAETAALLASTAAAELANFRPSAKRTTVTEIQSVVSNLANLLTSAPIGQVSQATLISQGSAIAALTANATFVTPGTQDRLIAYAAAVIAAIKNQSEIILQETGQVSLSNEATSAMCNALSNLARFFSGKNTVVSTQLNNAIRDLLLTVNWVVTPGDTPRSFGCGNLNFFAQSEYAANFNGRTFVSRSVPSSSPSPIPAAISLPSDFTIQVPNFDIGVTNTIQLTTNPYQSHPSSQNITSSVVSMTVYNGDTNGEIKVFNFTSKINITIPGAFKSSEYNYDCGRSGNTPVCRYWVDGSGWVADTSCILINITDTAAVCSCTHLTDFAVSVDFLTPGSTPIIPVPPKIIINMDPYNPTTTVFAGFSVIAYIFIFIILSIVERYRGARLTDQTDKNKKLIELGYFRRIIHNIQKYHTWIGIFFRPETEQNHFTRPQRLTVLFTILFVFMAVSSLLYGTYPFKRSGDAIFIVIAIAANLVAIPFSGLVTYIFRNTKIPTTETMRVANVTTFENKEFEIEDLSSVPPVRTAPSDVPETNAPDNLVTGTTSTNVPKVVTSPPTAQNNEPIPSEFTKSANINVTSSHALGNSDFEMEEYGSAPAPVPASNAVDTSQQNEFGDRPAAQNVDDDDDDDDDGDVLPVPPSLARAQQEQTNNNTSAAATTTAAPNTTGASTNKAPSQANVKKAQDKQEREETRAAIKKEFKSIEQSIGSKPARFAVRTTVGDIMDKGDDTFDALKLPEQAQKGISIALTIAFIFGFLIIQTGLVILFHFTFSWWWQPYFTTLYLLLSLVVCLAVFEIVYFGKKYEKWRTEKRWDSGIFQIVLPSVGILINVIAFIITLAVALGTQFWSTGFGIGHVVSVLVFELLIILLLGLFIYLSVARPSPATVAEASKKDQPFIAWWSIFIAYPLIWAFFLGCIAISITFGFYLSPIVGGMWIAAYALSIVLDIVVTKFWTVLVMGFNMPLFSQAVETIFFPKISAVVPKPAPVSTAVPVATTSSTTAPPPNNASSNNLVAEPEPEPTTPAVTLQPDPITS